MTDDTSAFLNSSVEGLINYAAKRLPRRIVERLEVLATREYDPEHEKPLNADSLRALVGFLERQSSTIPPQLGRNSEGLIESKWRKDRTHRLVVRFEHIDRILLAITNDKEQLSANTTLEKLVSGASSVKIPAWVNA